MKRIGPVHALIVLVLAVAWPAPGMAAERTITLEVDGITCVSCVYMVERSLERVDGVLEAEISIDERSATVTFDDERATVEQLTAATASAGFPARPKE